MIPSIAAAATRFGAAAALAWMVTVALIIPTGAAWREPLVLAYVGGALALWTAGLIAVGALVGALWSAVWKHPSAAATGRSAARIYGLVLLTATAGFFALRPEIVDGWIPEYVTRREPIVLVARVLLASLGGFVLAGGWVGLRHRRSIPMWLLALHYVVVRVLFHDAVWRTFDPRWWLLDLAGLVLLALGWSSLLQGPLLGWRRRVTIAIAMLGGATGVVLLASYGSNGAERASLHASYPGPAELVRLAQARMDLDGDGFASWLGGLDCDDDDPSVSPAALELVGNGIDDNCGGGDLTDAPAMPAPPKRRKGPEYSVIVITIDALRADMLSPEFMPNLARFAAQSATFTRAYAQASFTDNSIRSLMTGRYPMDFDTGSQFLGQEPSLAELLSAAGFDTYAVKVNALLTPYAFQGFAHVDDEVASLNERHDAVTSAQTADAVIAALDRRGGGGQPLLLWAHFADPHADYVGHPEAPIDGEDAAARYRQEVWFTDRHVGRVLDHMRSMGLFERSIVVVTSDHGELIGEGGRYGHATWLDEKVLRVPLVVRGPGVPVGRLTTRVRLIDVYPTVLRLAAGIDAASDGEDLREVWSGTPDVADRDVFARTTYDGHRQRAGIVGDHKIIIDLNHGTEVLLDLREDPEATSNRIDEDPEAASRLRTAVGQRWDRSINDATLARKQALFPSRQVPADVWRRFDEAVQERNCRRGFSRACERLEAIRGD